MSTGLSKFTDLPRADLPACNGSAFAVLNRVRSKLRQNWLNQIGRKYWQSQGLVSSEEFHHTINEAVGQKPKMLNHERHESTRKGRIAGRRPETQAGAAFSNPSHTSLHGILKSHRSFAARMALLLAPCARCMEYGKFDRWLAMQGCKLDPKI